MADRVIVDDEFDEYDVDRLPHSIQVISRKTGQPVESPKLKGDLAALEQEYARFDIEKVR